MESTSSKLDLFGSLSREKQPSRVGEPTLSLCVKSNNKPNMSTGQNKIKMHSVDLKIQIHNIKTYI